MGQERDIGGWDPDLQEILALKADILATQFIVRALILREALRKANFNPNQPRKPAGGPNGGEWAREGGASQPAGKPPNSSGEDGDSSDGRPVDNAPPRPRLHIEIWPSNGGPALDDHPPAIPETPPPERRA